MQHILNALLKALHQAHHWLWVSAGALAHRYENATSAGCTSNPSCSEAQAAHTLGCSCHLLPSPLVPWQGCNCRECDCALQLSSFYKEKHFFFPRNQKCKDQVFKVLFGGDCAGRKNKNLLSNLPDSKNIIFHISRHKLIMYLLGQTFPPSTLLSLHETGVRYGDTQNKIFTQNSYCHTASLCCVLPYRKMLAKLSSSLKRWKLGFLPILGHSTCYQQSFSSELLIL